MKILWAIFAIAMAGGVYFTPGPEAGESAMHYILAERTTWPAMTCIVVASFAGSILLMAFLMRSPRDT